MKYQLLDSGNRRKLEQIGEYRVIRPALNAAWRPELPDAEWQLADGVFERNSTGGGEWEWRRRPPEKWVVEWGGFKLVVKATGFGHIGFFAEQYRNWQWLTETCARMDNPETLNLFAYSGVASMAMAQGGAKVCHLDAAKGMNEWGRENLQHNPKVGDSIRWITDDVNKFTARELRRGSRYNGIVLDPPSFGRGAKGEVWKLEDGAVDLLESCRKLLDTGKPYFVLLSCHSPGFSPIVLERLLTDVISSAGKLSSGEMTVPDARGRELPAGIFARREVA